jgi:hypothetical protein
LQNLNFKVFLLLQSMYKINKLCWHKNCNLFFKLWSLFLHSFLQLLHEIHCCNFIIITTFYLCEWSMGVHCIDLQIWVKAPFVVLTCWSVSEHNTASGLLQQGFPRLQEKQPRSVVRYQGDEEVRDGEQKHGQPRWL